MERVGEPAVGRDRRPTVLIHGTRLSEIDISAFEKILSPDEIRRAAKLLRREDRRRWIAARCFLRRTLADTTDTTPRAVRFRYGKFGKPAIGADAGPSSPSFNLTHSGDVAVAAVCVSHPVGVDIECCGGSSGVDEDAIAKSCLTEREQAYLRGTSSRDRYRLLLWWWTCKEAYVKGTGKGLSEPLDAFEVTFERMKELPALASVSGSHQPVPPWTLRRLHLERGYVGTLAVPGRLEPDVRYDR